MFEQGLEVVGEGVSGQTAFQAEAVAQWKRGRRWHPEVKVQLLKACQSPQSVWAGGGWDQCPGWESEAHRRGRCWTGHPQLPGSPLAFLGHFVWALGLDPPPAPSMGLLFPPHSLGLTVHGDRKLNPELSHKGCGLWLRGEV